MSECGSSRRADRARGRLALLVGLALLPWILACPGSDEPKPGAWLATEQAEEARRNLAKLAGEPRLAALRELLASPAPEAQAVAAQVARSHFELALLPDLEAQVAQQARADGPLPATLAFLRAYQKIALPAEELRALLPPTNAADAKPGPGSTAVTAGIQVRDLDGTPVAGAQVLAYSRDYALRLPPSGFARADAEGKLTLELAQGAWTLLAVGGAGEASAAEPARGIFVRQEHELQQRNPSLTLQPDAEIAIHLDGIEPGALEAIHAIDPSLAQAVAFPSLGAGGRGFVLAATRGAPVALLVRGQAAAEQRWLLFEPALRAPATQRWQPVGDGSARLDFEARAGKETVQSAELTLRQYGHDATPVRVLGIPGQGLHLSPGTTQIEYSVLSEPRRFLYGPRPHELTAGQSLPFVLGPPDTTRLFHEHWPELHGRSQVLSVAVLAQDANGHFLTALRGPDNRVRAVPFRVRRGDEVVAEVPGANGQLFRRLADGIEADWLPELTYEIAGDLRREGRLLRVRGEGPVTVRSQHYRVRGPASLRAHLKQLAEGAEALRAALVGLHPAVTDEAEEIFVRSVLPPGVGAQTGPEGISLRASRLLASRWIERGTAAPLPHELLHGFGFGHDDFMAVWEHRLERQLRAGGWVAAMSPPEAGVQRQLLQLLRGSTLSGAEAALPWRVLGRFGLAPFQGYQAREKQWKPALQRAGASAAESNAAILSHTSGEDLRPWYAAAGLPLRSAAFEAARRQLAELHADGGAAAAGSDAELETTRRELEALLQRASAGAPDAATLAALRTALPRVEGLPLHRTRVRAYMHFGDRLFAGGAEDDAAEAFRLAQRAAARVGPEYLDRCRRLSTHVMLGKPLVLSHL